MNSFLTISILMVTASCLAWAQDVRFVTGTTNLHVDALAQQAGHVLHGLTKDDFVIRDGGQAQPILTFEEETVPLDLIVILDGPGIFARYGEQKNQVNKEGAAAMGSLSQIRAQDRTAVIFGLGPRVEQELTSDRTAIAAALGRAAEGVPTGNVPTMAIRGVSLQWAAWLLEADAKTHGSTGAGERKRAILMVTPGISRAWAPDEPVIRQLWSMDVALHIVTVPADRPQGLTIHERINGPRLDNMEHIAKATGGDIVVDEKGTLEKSLPDLLGRIRSTYSMWYRIPESKSGELHHITVELSDEAKQKYPNAEIKAREGYIAP